MFCWKLPSTNRSSSDVLPLLLAPIRTSLRRASGLALLKAELPPIYESWSLCEPFVTLMLLDTLARMAATY